MATQTTRRTDDGTVVAFPEAIAAWSVAARSVLERVATEYGAYVTYRELADAVQEEAGIVTGMPFRNWIGKVLGAVARSPREPDEPMLTALVVRADGTIGDGYGVPVMERDGVRPADLELHAAAERLACYRYFGAELPTDGGSPMLTAQVSAQRSKQRRTTKRTTPRASCPTCFVELPISGICGDCEADG